MENNTGGLINLMRLQKSTGTISEDELKRLEKAIQDLKLDMLTKYQKMLVADSTAVKLIENGLLLDNEYTVENILVALSALATSGISEEEFNEYKERINNIIINIYSLLDEKQNIQLSAETLEALDLGDDVQTVEDALIALKVEASKNIMCEDAQRYYEDQYHAMFNVTYALSCRVSGGGTINPATTTSNTFNLTATITGKATIKNPGVADETKDLTFTTAPVVSGWTLDETSSTATSKVYKKTVKFAEDGSGDYDFKADKTFSFPSTSFTYKKWDPVSKTEIEGTESGSTSGSTSVKITRSNFYWNNVNELTVTAFNSGYKTATKTYAGTFSDGTNSIQSVDQMPVIFASPTSGKKFEMLTKTIIVKQDSITTTLGTYYLYYSGKGNGTKWDVEVK